MPLPTNLNTNEVKDSTGSEVEFNRFDSAGRTLVFAIAGEPPNLHHRIKVSHQETGSGVSAVRRSLVRVDLDVTGTSGKVVTVSAYAVLVVPEGELANLNLPKNALAELMSFLATTGAGTTVLFDCSGSGAAALLNATL